MNINKNGGSLKGGVENYDQVTHKVNIGTIETSVAKKDYQKAEGNIGGSYKNGVFKGNVGGSYAEGTKYTGKIGDAQVTVGKEDKVSGNLGVKPTLATLSSSFPL